MSQSLRLLLAAAAGAGLAAGMGALADRPAAPPQATAPAPPPPPAALVDPAPARQVVYTVADEAGVPRSTIAHGLYPLRGLGRSPADTLPLISLTCPSGQTEGTLLAALSRTARAAGYSLVTPRGGDPRGRPWYRALSLGPRPALVVRLYPPGPRLTVIVQVEAGTAPADLLGLASHVTFMVNPERPEAEVTARTLQDAGREVIVSLPITPATPPEATGARLAGWFATLPGAVGGGQPGPAPVTASRAHMQAVMDALRARGDFYLAGPPDPARLDTSMARALGVRQLATSHRLSLPEGLEPAQALAAALDAVEASVALEGQAVVVAPASLALASGFSQWLETLERRGTHLVRASEVAL